MKSIIKHSRSFVHSFANTTIKPFDTIPGPKSFPIVGTLWAYFPVVGKYKFDRLHWNGFLKLKQFGPLVRENIAPGVSIVWVFEPNDIQTVYKCEGRFPQRRSHLALAKYRTDRPDVYNSAGLLPTNGPEWYRLRKIFQQDISKLQNVRLYLRKSDEVIKSFLNSRISNTHDDFLPQLSRLFLELIAHVAFDQSLNSFSADELKPCSRTSRLIEAAAIINGGVCKTDNGLQLYKKFDTPLYRRITKAHSYIESVAREFVEKKFTEIRSGNSTTNRQSLLEQFVSNADCDKKDVLGMTVDILLAGIDTLAFTCSFALYLISKNTSKQEILFDELKTVMPAIDDEICETMLMKITYTKAIMKEVFRMYPVSIGVGRILAKDAILSNYHVPAGTVVVTQNQVTCRLPQYFANPNEFIPERWLNESTDRPIHPYLVLPFGHGPRSCIARRLAEQNMQLLMMNMFRKFKVTWMGDELDCKSVQINEPDRNIKLRFEERIT